MCESSEFSKMTLIQRIDQVDGPSVISLDNVAAFSDQAVVSRIACSEHLRLAKYAKPITA